MSEAPNLSPVLWFAPELVVELALGAEHPHDIAERYGLEPEQYEHLDSLPWFHEMVARKRLEFHDNGLLFQAKAAMMAEALLTNLFQRSMSDKLTPPVMIEVSKQLVDIGRLKPAPGLTPANSGGGPAFQINIQVNGETRTLASSPDGNTPPTDPAAGSTTLTLDLSPMEAQRPQGAAGPTLGPPPAYISNLATPNFDRDVRPRPSALTGTPAAQAAAVTPAPPAAHVGLPRRSPLG